MSCAWRFSSKMGSIGGVSRSLRVSETRTPLPVQPGRPARYDYEYERNGTASLFMLFAPLEGWRDVKVSERRTAIEYAQVLKDLSDINFPKAEKIVLVQNNLNTHTPASLYEAFTASEARRLVERFEWRYTPKHGSWLNMAESELAILSSQCLDRRIPDQRNLQRQVAAWLLHRNTHNVKADWRFTAADAGIKLKSLYPALWVIQATSPPINLHSPPISVQTLGRGKIIECASRLAASVSDARLYIVGAWTCKTGMASTGEASEGYRDHIAVSIAYAQTRTLWITSPITVLCGDWPSQNRNGRMLRLPPVLF